jgi:hypothetical protein
MANWMSKANGDTGRKTCEWRIKNPVIHKAVTEKTFGFFFFLLPHTQFFFVSFFGFYCVVFFSCTTFIFCSVLFVSLPIQACCLFRPRPVVDPLCEFLNPLHQEEGIV